MYTIITREQCSFCDVAKTLLKSKGLPYVEYNVHSPSSRWVLSLLKKTNNPLIGGCTQLQKLLQEDNR
jgi:glutaredoxin